MAFKLYDDRGKRALSLHRDVKNAISNTRYDQEKREVRLTHEWMGHNPDYIKYFKKESDVVVPNAPMYKDSDMHSDLDYALDRLKGNK